jgi:Protein of unknown function (DUF732)
MVAHRRSGRFVGLAAIGCPLVVAGIVGAGPALLQTGQKLCVQVSYGVTSDQLTALAVQRSDSREGASGLTPLQASELVNYAIADLCPNH